MAKLWPSRNWIVVCALRWSIDGIVVPDIVTDWVKSSSLTSGAIRRLIKPSFNTVGTKERLTPNGTIVNEGVLPVVVLETVGTGKLPPARNFAFSPDSVTRLGSARRRTNPC